MALHAEKRLLPRVKLPAYANPWFSILDQAPEDDGYPEGLDGKIRLPDDSLTADHALALELVHSWRTALIQKFGAIGIRQVHVLNAYFDNSSWAYIAKTVGYCQRTCRRDKDAALCFLVSNFPASDNL